MKVPAENIKSLQQLTAASIYNKELLSETIKLYQDRKIKRIDTAKCIVNNL